MLAMPARGVTVANKIVHLEFMGADGNKQAEFYKANFGWEMEAVPGFDAYHMVSSDIGVGTAVGRGPDEGPTYLTAYIEVDDIDAALAKIEGSGGATIMPRTVVPGTVVFAMFGDPAGNVVGLVEPDTPEAE